ncbi:MAG: NADH-quinone oxidoreductase subunit L [Actinomycetota bacterium]
MWFLENAWLIPLIPAVSFVLILVFGKRMPRHGSEIGIGAVGASFLLACGSAYQWIQHVDDAEGGAEGGHAVGRVLGALGHSVGHLSAEEEGHGVVVEPIIRSTTWLQNGGVDLNVGIQIDGLAVVVMFVVTLVSLLVHIYSTEYMRDDRRYTHFFAALSLFTASMLLLVVADNTLQFLVGWELVGLCSFMLIGHWWEEKPNSDAALKAFFTTRTGDIGLLCGVIMTYFIVDRATGEGSFNIMAINDAATNHGGAVGSTLLFWCGVGLLLGIIGKSGQFPLHTWLPDAMAGPTPVSALIHAATMVVAGVYLGARLFPVFYEGFDIGDGGVNPMALIGGITVIIGAALAFVQDDIKKVLAYSTISQLGYMVMGLGVGAWVAAVFHLFTHAFFKANLFLGAGSVSHSGAHHSFDMKKDMGGLRKYMPQTFWTFVIGSLALAGIFPLAGFWSKDEILLGASENDYKLFFYVGLIGAFMTAAYMTRCVYLVFFGEYRGGDHGQADPEPAPYGDRDEHAEDDRLPAHAALADHHGEPHESNRLITGPLWVLTAFSAFAGLLNAPGIEKFSEWFDPNNARDGVFVFPEFVREHHEFSVTTAAISVAIALLGIAVSHAYYWRQVGPQRLSERNGAARAGKNFLVNKYYLDWLYERVIVRAIKGPIAAAAYWVNQHVIDNVLNYTGRGARALGRVTYDYVDQKGVDGIVNGIGITTGEAGGAIRQIQTGRLQLYALMLVLAVGVFAAALWIAN